MSDWLASVTTQNVPRIMTAAGLIGLALVAFYLFHRYYRRRLMEAPPPGAFPWTLEDLRSMRDRGEVTEREFQTLRANLLGQARMGEIGSPEPVARQGQQVGTEGKKADPSGDTVWSFDLKKTPPG